MTDINAKTHWGRLGAFPLRCEVCDWNADPRDRTTDARHRRGLVDAETQHRQTMHPEGTA